MQKLYDIIFPPKDIPYVNDMYLKGNKYTIEGDQCINIEKNGNISFGTYMNSFSIEKWYKYTSLSSLSIRLSLKGKFKLTVFNKYLTAGDYLDKILFVKEYNLVEREEVFIDLSEFISNEGILFFDIFSMNDSCIFYKASYETQNIFTRKSIGISICTYKREKYIERFIKNFDLCSSKDYLEAFIADNGNTLPITNNNKIRIFQNKNFGGAGGFGRCMLEVQKYNETADNKLDFILFMDDDIVIDFNLFEKLISFLSLKKEKYDNYFFSGGMCSLDYPFLQYEKYASWRGNRFIQFCPNYNLNDMNTIITNEREEHLDHCSAGWWFSCFSTKMLTPNNFPFPCFFRGDDMEFTIRNGSNIITLNGVCVWHEPFYKKYSIVSENYYLFRNAFVINSLYLNDLSKWIYIKYIFRRFAKSIITYDYKSAELLIQAMIDYSKGVSFFEITDPEKLNQDLSKKNYKLQPIEKLIDEYKFDDINYYLYHQCDKNRNSRLRRLLSLNGFLIPKFLYKNFSFTHIGFASKPINFYKIKNVLVLDPFTKKGYLASVNKLKAILLTYKFFVQILKFILNFKKIKKEYQRNFYKITNKSFWKKYLNI